MNTALVTGGTGCIGAVTVRDLLARDVARVVIATRSSEASRLRLWLGEALDPRIEFASVDLGCEAAVRDLVRHHQPTHVVHLAALQSPDCDRDPELGLRINVGSTQALLEACERLDAPPLRFVFASSAAVYGPRAMYPGATVREDDPLRPPNRYGVWKLAGEGIARLFHGRTAIPTVCLRLNTTFGPGRDRGMTSAPTSAMKNIALGSARGEVMPFRMPYRGRENYHYVEDVGACFAAATLDPFAGFEALNILGTTIEVDEFLQRIGRAAKDRQLGDYVDLGVEDDAAPNLFVSDLDDSAFATRFPRVSKTALDDGIERSLRRFLDVAS